MKTALCRATAISIFLPMLVLSLAVGQASRCYAQMQAQPDAHTNVAALREPSPGESDTGAANGTAPTPARPAAAPEPEMTVAIEKELAAMRGRIEQLETELTELKGRTPVGQPSSTAAADLGKPGASAPVVTTATNAAPATSALTGWLAQPSASSPSQTPDAAPARKEKIAPFSDWDWTWLNGNPRNRDTAFDSKFFTPEIRADVTYSYDFNKPVDNSMGGSSELFRSNEIQLEQLGLGGDFHYDNVRARFMTQFGMYSTATIRNDPATPRGNGISPMRIATWRKHMAAITLTR